MEPGSLAPTALGAILPIDACMLEFQCIVGQDKHQHKPEARLLARARDCVAKACRPGATTPACRVDTLSKTSSLPRWRRHMATRVDAFCRGAPCCRTEIELSVKALPRKPIATRSEVQHKNQRDRLPDHRGTHFPEDFPGSILVSDPKGCNRKSPDAGAPGDPPPRAVAASKILRRCDFRGANCLNGLGCAGTTRFQAF